MKHSVRWLPSGLLLGVVLGGCMRNIVEELPSGPEPSPSASSGPVTPVPVGVTPTPTPTPTIIPTPTPRPTPEPTPTSSTPPPPTTSSCRLPRGSGNGENCPRTTSAFLGDVQASIRQLIQDQPGIFSKREC